MKKYLMVAFLGVALSPASYAQYDPSCIQNCVNNKTGVCMAKNLAKEAHTNKLYQGLSTSHDLCEKCCQSEKHPGSRLSE